MALANVALTDTFDIWRTRTNQLVVQSNFFEVNLPNYTYANNIGVQANAYANLVGAGANSYMITIQNGSNTAVGQGANAYANLVGQSANAYMITIQNGSNTAVGQGANAYTNAYAALLTGYANTNASNATYLSIGTVPSARVSGSYTNITGVGTLTAGTWNATNIALNRGGTNASLTACSGGIVYCTSSAFAITPAGSLDQVLKHNGLNNSPSWVSQSTLSVGYAVAAGSASSATTAGSATTATTATNLSGGSVSATTGGFSGAVTVSGTGAITLATSGDITCYRSGGTTGVIYFGSSGGRYLFYDGTNYILQTASLQVGGDITAFASDERLKKDIVEIQNPLDKLLQIRGVHYRHNDFALEQGLPDEAFVGVIAQEIEKVLPEVVTLAPFDYEGVDSSGKKISKSGENYKTVKYEKIVPLLIEAIKELTAKVEMLESKAGK